MDKWTCALICLNLDMNSRDSVLIVMDFYWFGKKNYTAVYFCSRILNVVTHFKHAANCALSMLCLPIPNGPELNIHVSIFNMDVVPIS